MIKVLHIVHTMECGGIETMLMNVYRHIDRTKIQFDFLVNGSAQNYYTNEILSLGGKVLNVTPKRVNFFKNIKETTCILKNGNYQVVHIHQDSMIAFGIWCSKMAKIKTIFTHAHTTSAQGWYRRFITKNARKYIVKNSNLRFACSKEAANWIYGKNVDYLLFRNAIDASKFRFSKKKYDECRKKLHINNNTFIVGTCGRYSIEKNQKFLIDIFFEIKKTKKDSKLILVGDGAEKNNLISYSKDLNVFEDIIFTGLVNNPDLYYNVMDCFVLTSFYEGLPLVGVEAQAAGIPSFFSTGITKDLKITDEVYFLDLKKGAMAWSEFILKNSKDRRDNYRKICEFGYDIGQNVKLLESKYESYSSNLKGEK